MAVAMVAVVAVVETIGIGLVANRAKENIQIQKSPLPWKLMHPRWEWLLDAEVPKSKRSKISSMLMLKLVSV